MNIPSVKETVENANIIYHMAISDTYDEQPHFLPENKTLVSKKLKYLSSSAGNDVLVDFGCGTGFIIQLALPYFNTVYGIDITPAMMSKVDLSSGKVKLIRANTESVPLNEGVASVVTSNSFLHHLWDIRPTVVEANRILKNGGVFYSEEDPNTYFWQSLNNLKDSYEKLNVSFSDFLQDELASVLDTHTLIADEKDINTELIKMAEYQKMIEGGMCPEEIEKIFYEAGFSDVKIDYYWFLGQGKVIHQESSKEAEVIESYLHSILPLSKNMFKYLRVEAWK